MFARRLVQKWQQNGNKELILITPSNPAGGKPVDASQEMIALGLCNLSGSLVRSMPTTGSFSRTAVNFASGVKTQAGGIYTGVLVLLVSQNMGNIDARF
jgi:MFS superfamily sulfate permease-like transporter